MHFHGADTAMAAIDGVSRQAETILAAADQTLARRGGTQEPRLAGQREITRTTIAGTTIGKCMMLDVKPEPLIQPHTRSLKLGKRLVRRERRDSRMADRMCTDLDQRILRERFQHLPGDRVPPMHGLHIDAIFRTERSVMLGC